jgi:hypothetical protein
MKYLFYFYIKVITDNMASKKNKRIEYFKRKMHRQKQQQQRYQMVIL